jgi:GDP-L-fucose synthase
MRILVTGGGGMVGRTVLSDPRAANHEMLAPTRAELDLTDAAATADYVARHRPDLILHLAARVGGIQANIAEPDLFLAENLAIGLAVIGAAARAGTPGLVNLGTSCMYPLEAPRPLHPSSLLTGSMEPTSEAYTLAKLASWKLTQTLGLTTPGATWRTIIPPNLYGPYDHFDAVRSHLIPAIVLKIDAAMAAGDDEVTIWGDGSARREFMYAADLADFLWRFHDRLDALPETMNVGVGADHSVDDYYRTVGDVLGYTGRFKHDTARPTGIAHKLLDITAQRDLGWSPATSLRDGVAATAACYRAAL